MICVVGNADSVRVILVTDIVVAVVVILFWDSVLSRLSSVTYSNVHQMSTCNCRNQFSAMHRAACYVTLTFLYLFL